MPNSSSSFIKSKSNESANLTKHMENAAPRIDAVLFDYGQVLSGPPDPAA